MSPDAARARRAQAREPHASPHARRIRLPGDCRFRVPMGYCGRHPPSLRRRRRHRFQARPSARKPRIERLTCSSPSPRRSPWWPRSSNSPSSRTSRSATPFPHPVLVLGVIWAIAGGLEAGLAWAFVGGLALDILGQRPLGSSAFALLMRDRRCFRRRWLLRPDPHPGARRRHCYREPGLFDAAACRHRRPKLGADLRSALSPIVPSAVYDTALAAVVGPLVVAIVVRRRETERVDW